MGSGENKAIMVYDILILKCLSIKYSYAAEASMLNSRKINTTEPNQGACTDVHEISSVLMNKRHHGCVALPLSAYRWAAMVFCSFNTYYCCSFIA